MGLFDDVRIPGIPGGIIDAVTGAFGSWWSERGVNQKLEELGAKLNALDDNKVKLPKDDKTPSEFLKFLANGLNQLQGKEVVKPDGLKSDALLKAINEYTTAAGGPAIENFDQLSPKHLALMVKDMREKGILKFDKDNQEVKMIVQALGKALHEVDDPDIKKIASDLAPGYKPPSGKPRWGAENSHGEPDVVVASAKGGYVAPEDRLPSGAQLEAALAALTTARVVVDRRPEITPFVAGGCDVAGVDTGRARQTLDQILAGLQRSSEIIGGIIAGARENTGGSFAASLDPAQTKPEVKLDLAGRQHDVVAVKAAPMKLG